MKQLLKNILAEIAAGLAQAMAVAPGRRYVLPPQHGFRKDASALGRDARNVANDLNNTFRQ